MTRQLKSARLSTTPGRIGLALAGLALLAVDPLGGSAPHEREPDRPTVIEPSSDEERARYLRMAQVWTDRRTGELDLRIGPVEGLAFDPSRGITCDYHTPGVALGGATPKFLCQVGNDVFKVKYVPSRRYGTSRPRGRSGDREIYAELAGTRLFWALGFGADRVFLVPLRCHGCPSSPHDGPNDRERQSGRYRQSTRPLGTVLIEKRFDGATIEESSDQGWKWTELSALVGQSPPAVDRLPSSPGTAWMPARREHVDALQLLQVFVQHGDCKPEQQRLVCLREGVVRREPVSDPTADLDDESPDSDDDGVGYSCRHPYAIVDDLGATFGGAGAFTRSSAKMSLKHWAEKTVLDMEYYRDTGGLCRGVLKTSNACSGGVENPPITEAGRQFLLERLSLLSDAQIHDLFAAARVAELCDDPAECGVAAWVATFKDKVRQIAAHPCRSPATVRSSRGVSE